jgi:hypothetical protein
VCGLDSTVLGQGPVAGCCVCGDEPSGSCSTELVSLATVTSVVSSNFFGFDFYVRVLRVVHLKGILIFD